MRQRLSRVAWLWFLVVGAAASVVAVVRSRDTFDPFWILVQTSGLVLLLWDAFPRVLVVAHDAQNL